MESNKETYNIELIPYRIKDKWGYANIKKEIIIPCIFDECKQFRDNIAIVKKDGKYGFIDLEGNFVIQNKFDDVQPFRFNLSQVKLGDKYGCIDKEGNIVVPVEHEYLLLEFQGMCFEYRVKMKRGILDLKGNIVIPADYYAIQVSSIVDSKLFFRASLVIDKKVIWFILDSNNIRISDYYDHIDLGYKKLDIDYSEEALLLVRKDNKYGAINHKGEITVPLNYDLIYNLSSNSNIAKLNGEFGLIDKKGITVLPFEFERIMAIRNTSLFFVCKDKKIGIINEDGQILLPIKYFEGRYRDSVEYSNGLIRVEENGKFGLIDLNGNIKLSIDYDRIYEFNKIFVKAQRSNKYGIVNTDGSIIVPFEYDDINRKTNKAGVSFYIVKKNDLIGMLNSEGKLIRPFSNEEIDFFGTNLFIIKDSKKKLGLINVNNELILNCKYSKIGDSNNNCTTENYDLITIGRKQGIVNFNGKIVIDCKYKQMFHEWGEVYSVVTENNKKGYVDTDNSEYWED